MDTRDAAKPLSLRAAAAEKEQQSAKAALDRQQLVVNEAKEVRKQAQAAEDEATRKLEEAKDHHEKAKTK